MLEHLATCMLLTSTLAINYLIRNFLNKAIGIKLRKTVSKFYRLYYDLISKFKVGLKSLLRQGLSEPEFYGDLVYKLKMIVGFIVFQRSLLK